MPSKKRKEIEYSYEHPDYIPRKSGRRHDPFAGETIGNPSGTAWDVDGAIQKTVQAFKRGAPGVKFNIPIAHHKNFDADGNPVGTAMTSTPHQFMMTRGSKETSGAYGDFDNMPTLRYGANVDNVITRVATEMKWKPFKWTGKTNAAEHARWQYSARADQALGGDTGKCSAYVARMAQEYPGLQKCR